MNAAAAASSSSSSAAGGAGKKKSSTGYTVSVRLTVAKFDTETSVIPTIWFGATHAPNSKLTKLYLSFPPHQRVHNDRLKMWTFDFALYDKVSGYLQSDEFDFVELTELPKFLVEGLRKYVQKVTADPYTPVAPAPRIHSTIRTSARK